MIATITNPIPCRPMIPDESAFFHAMSSRVASAHQDADLIQAELAGALGIAQPRLASHEAGRRRVPVSLMPRLDRALSVTIEELIGEQAPQPMPGRRELPSRIQTQPERIQALPKVRQRFLADMIEMALQQGGQHS